MKNIAQMKSVCFVLVELVERLRRYDLLEEERESELSEQAAGEKDKPFMKKRKKIDPDMPIGKLTVVPDFLPPPEELAKAKTVITTIGLDAETIAYFKREARKR